MSRAEVAENLDLVKGKEYGIVVSEKNFIELFQ
jgi:hypothetical protein